MNTRSVLIMQLPERLDLTQARQFWPEVAVVLEEDRPRLVFDFSEVRQIDSAGVEVLLKGLEAVMRLDGDLKLAALRPEVAVILELTRVDRLFEIFAAVDGAVESFRGFVVQESSQSSDTWYPRAFPGNGDAADRRAAS
jgi:anti-sigma B factor antagonist